MNNLKGKTAVITGGNSGVGAATALLFAKSGANVVISARRQAALEEVAGKIKAEGGNVLTVPTDISKDEDCKQLMKAAVDAFGRIDILVNNAGVLDTGLAPVDKFDDVETQKVISINQIGTMQCIRAALQYMTEGASIVNVASVAGVNGGGGAAYVSTKSAIIGITKDTASAAVLSGTRIRAPINSSRFSSGSAFSRQRSASAELYSPVPAVPKSSR